MPKLKILPNQQGFDFGSQNEEVKDFSVHEERDNDDDNGILSRLESVMNKQSLRDSIKSKLPTWKPTSEFGNPLAFQMVSSSLHWFTNTL